MIRLSVTELETLRYWKDRDDRDLADLLADLRKESPPSPQMAAGRAFAKFFETTPIGYAGTECEIDGWRFSWELDVEVEIPDARELKGELHMDTPSGPVTLVGMVDGLDGRWVHDQKLTEQWEAEKYIDSLQWRAYLVMFEATAFVYDVFVGRYKRDKDRQIVPGQVTVTDYHRMPFYTYPGIERDVQLAVNELAAIVARHLPERVVANG
jgi:hypothetical protein